MLTFTISLQVMLENRDADVPCPCLPKPVNLARRANRARQKLRPKEPECLFFPIDFTYVPESFVQDDVTVTGRRHIVLASAAMLSLLGKANTWLVHIPQSC